MPTFSQVTGASGTDPAVPTAPLVDGTIRGSLVVLANAVVGAAAAFGLDLSAEQVIAGLAVVNGAIVVCFAIFDKAMWARQQAARQQSS